MKKQAIRLEISAQKKMAILGQSFGGFCLLTYLSRYPSSLDCGIFTCGLAPVGQHVDDVYRATFKRILERNKRYYERSFPITCTFSTHISLQIPRRHIPGVDHRQIFADKQSATAQRRRSNGDLSSKFSSHLCKTEV